MWYWVTVAVLLADHTGRKPSGSNSIADPAIDPLIAIRVVSILCRASSWRGVRRGPGRQSQALWSSIGIAIVGHTGRSGLLRSMRTVRLRTHAFHVALGLHMPGAVTRSGILFTSASPSADWGFPQLKDIAETSSSGGSFRTSSSSAIDVVVDALVVASPSALQPLTSSCTPGRSDCPIRTRRTRRTTCSGRAAALPQGSRGLLRRCGHHPRLPLAAVLIVVTRVPFSIQRADFQQLIRTRTHEVATPMRSTIRCPRHNATSGRNC